MLLATFSLSDYQGWGIPLSSEMGIRCELDWVLHLLRGAQMQEQLSKVFSCTMPEASIGLELREGMS